MLVQCQKELVPLLKFNRYIDEVLTLEDEISASEYDLEIEVMELPYAFRTQLSTIPREVPYLKLDVPKPKNQLPFAVGLVWKAGEWDPRRSIPFPLIQSIENEPGLTLHAIQLQTGGNGESLGSIIDSSSADIVAAARAISQLDLLITVDSMPAHLAGALGVRTWTLLHAECDWRWMAGRSDSPWYPTMRLIRQRQPGDWRPVLDRVKSDLRFLVSRMRGY